MFVFQSKFILGKTVYVFKLPSISKPYRYTQNASKVKFVFYVLICKFVRIKVNQMDTKLTLKLDSSVIENAKVYAKMKKVSLSQLIEAYLNVLTEPKDQQDVTPLVKSLSGVVKLPGNYDYKKEYQKHLSGKYSK